MLNADLLPYGIYLLALIGIAYFTVRAIRNIRLIDSMESKLLSGFHDLSLMDNRIMFWIKDANGRYLYATQSLLYNLYPDKSIDEIRGKSDYELVTNKVIEDFDPCLISIRKLSTTEASVRYDGLDDNDIVCFVSDLITITTKKSFEFIELIRDNLLLSVVKYPVFSGNKLKYLVGVGMVCNSSSATELFNAKLECIASVPGMCKIKEANIIVVGCSKSDLDMSEICKGRTFKEKIVCRLKRMRRPDSLEG